MIKVKTHIVLVICCLFMGCNKDYPDDIPQWLKEQIKVWKREDGCRGYYAATRSAYEYKNIHDGSKIYRIPLTYDPATGIFYDWDHNVICEYDYWGSTACLSFINDNYVYEREVWIETPKRCP